MKISALLFLVALLSSSVLAQSATALLISIPEQRMQVVDGLRTMATFPVSTSKFGLGSRRGSYRTPVGELKVSQKIGAGLPSGMKLKHRRPTGEIVRPNTPGRDPIVSRILRLAGLDAGTAGAQSRGIYIHGTPEERKIGKPASYGCVRMKSADIIRLFGMVTVGTRVTIANATLGSVTKRRTGIKLAAQ